MKLLLCLGTYYHDILFLLLLSGGSRQLLVKLSSVIFDALNKFLITTRKLVIAFVEEFSKRLKAQCV